MSFKSFNLNAVRFLRAKGVFKFDVILFRIVYKWLYFELKWLLLMFLWNTVPLLKEITFNFLTKFLWLPMTTVCFSIRDQLPAVWYPNLILRTLNLYNLSVLLLLVFLNIQQKVSHFYIVLYPLYCDMVLLIIPH